MLSTVSVLRSQALDGDIHCISFVAREKKIRFGYLPKEMGSRT